MNGALQKSQSCRAKTGAMLKLCLVREKPVFLSLPPILCYTLSLNLCLPYCVTLSVSPILCYSLCFSLPYCVFFSLSLSLPYCVTLSLSLSLSEFLSICLYIYFCIHFLYVFMFMYALCILLLMDSSLQHHKSFCLCSVHYLLPRSLSSLLPKATPTGVPHSHRPSDVTVGRKEKRENRRK